MGAGVNVRVAVGRGVFVGVNVAVATTVTVGVAVTVGVGVHVGVFAGGGGGGSPSPITRTMSDAGDPTSYSAKTGFTRTRMVLSVGVLSGTPYETAATSISPARNAKACRSAVWSVDGSNI